MASILECAGFILACSMLAAVFYCCCISSDNEEEEEKYYYPNGLNSAPSDSRLEEIKTEGSIKMETSYCIHNDQRGDQMNLEESKNGENTKGKNSD